jgi:hypothetical protein
MGAGTPASPRARAKKQKTAEVSGEHVETHSIGSADFRPSRFVPFGV